MKRAASGLQAPLPKFWGYPRQVKILDINSAQQGGNKSTSEPVPKDSTMLLEEGEIIDDVPKVNILYEVTIFDDDTRIDIESKMDGIGSDESVDDGSVDARDATQRIVGSVADEVGMEADSLSMEKPPERPAPTTRTEREQPASVDVNALQVELEEEKNDNERSHRQCVDSAQYRLDNTSDAASSDALAEQSAARKNASIAREHATKKWNEENLEWDNRLKSVTKHRDDRKATFDSAQENDDKANLDLASARESETFAVHEAAIIRDEKIEDARLHRRLHCR